jgi:WD40-like Beta Propeller Repeat
MSVAEAVIADARRHTRRRRLRTALLVIAVAVAGASFYFGLRPSAPASFARPPAPIKVAPINPPMRNGALTIMDVPAGGSGWYGVSKVGSGDRLRPLVRCPRHNGWCGEMESIDWSPDGSELAFAVTSFAANNPYNGIHVFDVAAGREVQIVHQGENSEYGWRNLDWSPDGHRLAYGSDAGIVVVNANGTGREVLHGGGSPSWSPDGRWIAFSRAKSVYAMRRNGTDVRLVARDGSRPAWSPDGTRIAFLRGAGIVFVTPSGTILAPRPPFRRGVPIGFKASPTWSPDGKKIALARLGAHPGTYVMNADGSHLHRVSTHAVALAVGTGIQVAWRPRAR